MSPQFPQLPETRVTRQIECVSCRHNFTVSEDIPNRNGDCSLHWIRIPDHYPFINPRHRNDIYQQPSNPESNGHLYESGDAEPFQRGIFQDIVCPRCGTDNRNWVHLTIPPLSLMQRLRKAPVLMLSSLVAIFLLFIAMPQMTTPEAGIRQRNILIFIITILILGGLLPFIVSSQWRALRDHRYETRLGISRSFWSRIPPAVRTTVITFLILWGIIPFIIFILLPWARFQVESGTLLRDEPTLNDRIITLIEEMPAAIIQSQGQGSRLAAENSIIQLSQIVNEVEQSCNTSSLPTMIVSLQSMVSQNPSSPRTLMIQDAIYQLQYLQTKYNSACQKELITRAESSLNTLRQHEDTVCEANDNSDACTYSEVIDSMITDLDRLQINATDQAPLGEIAFEDWPVVLQRLQPIARSVPNNAAQQQIENNLRALEQFAQIGTWFTTSAAFLVMWILYVGLIGTISIFCSIAAVNTIMRWADRQLPRPIYTNISRLTRVVIWEAKRTLEINNNYFFENIQWIRANRNELGGVDLIGLFRDPPDITGDGLIHDQVRAQQYMLRSDRWGHIEEAIVVDRHMPLPAGYQPPEAEPPARIDQQDPRPPYLPPRVHNRAETRR